MTLNDLFKLVSDSQKIVLIDRDSDMKVAGSQDALGAMLNNDVFSEKVTDIEARADELWIWIEEDE